MNDHHKLNAHGLRLVTTYEKGDPSVPLTPGGAAMEPYVCPGDELTIGYGCTKWFGGRPVEATDRLSDEASALALLAEQLVEYEDAVRNLVTVPLNSNQFSALVCFAFNCGIKALAGSTLLRHVNASRFDDAADAFGMWLYSTSGQHKQALRGLLRRRYSEAALWFSYDFEVACSDEAVALVRERPPNNIGTDRVLFKTPFKDVLTVAQRYPLPPLDNELILTTPAPSPPVAVEAAQRQPADPARSPVAAGAAVPKPSATVSGPAEAAPVAPPVPAPQQTQARPAPASVTKPPDPPVPIGQQTSAVDGAKRSEEWSANTKAMWQSRRFYGLVLIMAGRLWMLKTGSNAFLGAVSDPLVMEFVGGFCVMIAGELVQSWGRAKAKRALH